MLIGGFFNANLVPPDSTSGFKNFRPASFPHFGILGKNFSCKPPKRNSNVFSRAAISSWFPITNGPIRGSRSSRRHFGGIVVLLKDDNARPHVLGSIVTSPAKSVPEGVEMRLLIDDWRHFSDPTMTTCGIMRAPKDLIMLGDE